MKIKLPIVVILMLSPASQLLAAEDAAAEAAAAEGAAAKDATRDGAAEKTTVLESAVKPELKDVAPPMAPSIAVIPFQARTASDETLFSMEKNYRQAAALLNTHRIQPRAETIAHLEGARSIGISCELASNPCMKELGEIANVEQLIVATFTDGENRMVMHIRLIDVASGADIRRVDDWVDVDPAAWAGDLQRIAARTLAPNRAVGVLRLKVTPPGATVIVDGEERGLSPLPGPLRGMVAGRHRVVVSLDGYQSIESNTVIGQGASTILEIALKPLATAGAINPANPVAPSAETENLEVVDVEQPPLVDSMWPVAAMGGGGILLGSAVLALVGSGAIFLFDQLRLSMAWQPGETASSRYATGTLYAGLVAAGLLAGLVAGIAGTGFLILGVSME